jgi:hypothetical protein
MSGKTSTKNGQPVKEMEFEFDIEELREQLGIDALERELDTLREMFGEWLLYLNMMDERQQRLEGEPVLTAKHKLNKGPDGRFDIERSRPPLPDNLLARGKAPASPRLIEQK